MPIFVQGMGGPPMKATLLVSALIAVVMPFAAAQDNDRLPQASLDREINIPRAGGTVAAGRLPDFQTPPTFCKPCLFYAGDFDSDASDANGLANEVDITVSSGATTYTPFIVPKGKTWTVTGLFTVEFMSSTSLDPDIVPYEVRKDIPKSGGNGGHLVCHGKRTATVMDTAICEDFGYQCYAVIAKNVKSCRLPSGKYWLTVVPYCMDKNTCSDWRAFVTNDDGAMAHRYGPLEPASASFFNSEFFGANWEPSSQQQTSKRFSVGVEGTAK
jgi:hypothetical protein